MRECEGYAIHYDDDERFGTKANGVIREHFGDKVTSDMMKVFEELPKPESKFAYIIKAKKAKVEAKINDYPDSWGTW